MAGRATAMVERRPNKGNAKAAFGSGHWSAEAATSVCSKCGSAWRTVGPDSKRCDCGYVLPWRNIVSSCCSDSQ
jgi:hypothetical protein